MFTAKTQSRIHSSMSAIGIPLVIPMLRRIQKAACAYGNSGKQNAQKQKNSSPQSARQNMGKRIYDKGAGIYLAAGKIRYAGKCNAHR